MFIELTIYGSDKKVLVNIDNVVEICPRELNDGTNMYLPFEGNNIMSFKESYEQVKELIKREVQAERGY